MDKDLEEEKIASKNVFEGRMLNVFVDTVRLPDGKSSTREYVKHPGAVAIVPVADNGDILLVRQYRYPVGDIMLEVPAGKLEPGEDPDACAARELAEETGFAPRSLRKLRSIYTTPGFTDEIIHLYLAKGLTEGALRPDDDEFLRVERFTKEQLGELHAHGELNDAKTLLSLLLAGVLA